MIRDQMRRFVGGQAAAVAFVVSLLLGLAMTGAVFLAERHSALTEFERSADLAVDRVLSKLSRHVILLRATKGLFDVTDEGVSHQKFSSFVGSVDIVAELKGVQGIGFARMMATGAEAAAEAEVLGNYGLRVTVRPETTVPYRAPIVLLEPPDARNVAALGFDMYAEPVRRAAMDSAIATGQPQITGPVKLVQEITADKQTGFLIYLPYGPGDGMVPITGFVYAPFRAGDLIRAALQDGQPLPVAMKVMDASAGHTVLYEDPALADATGLSARRLIEVMGRSWSFELRDSTGHATLHHHYGSMLLGLSSLLFAWVAAQVITGRQQEAARARALAAAAAREAEYRGLLLQEMKHRIKNHIARIQSIARQSARRAVDVKSFTETFDARLQSMAAVQEILAGNAAAEADVEAILRKELQQGLDCEALTPLLHGPKLPLPERQAHALALVFHELVTNALKYGGLSSAGQGLQIDWRLEADTSPRQVVIDWQERFNNPEGRACGGPGFGSRLIEASIRGELSGRIERRFHDGGLAITLRFPLA